MKRSNAIEKLVWEFDLSSKKAAEILDFLEKEIGMLPPDNGDYRYAIGFRNQWESETNE